MREPKMKMLNAYSEATQFVKGIEAFLCIMSGKLWSEDQIWTPSCCTPHTKFLYIKYLNI